mmetsp:Transcript_21667/g.58316  ORF Transcript_21667/g.58316 Transcript_21667/m.58316 type:complete len:768 (-) Transcript_21667:198-2501(-)
MFKNPFDVYAKYTKRKNELCALVAEARRLLDQLGVEHARFERIPHVEAWKWPADMPTDLELQQLMERLVNDRVQVIVMGETKNGKSTLINALLGAEVLPAANTPCTSVVCSVQYADNKYALATPRDRQEVGAKEMIDLKYAGAPGASSSAGVNGMFWGWGSGTWGGTAGSQQAHAAPKATSSASVAGSGDSTGSRSAVSTPARSDASKTLGGGGVVNGAGPHGTGRIRAGDALRPYVVASRAQRDAHPMYAHVEVFWPLPLLRHQVVLIDTPGLNERASMDEVVHKHLPQADAVIFVLNGTKAITDVEARAISQVRARLGHEHMFVVTNKVDQIPAEDLDETQKWVSEAVGDMLPGVVGDEDSVLKGTPNRYLFLHFVSADQALRAARRGEEPPKAFRHLHDAVGRYLNAERFKPKLLSGSAALLHALRTATSALETHLAHLKHGRERLQSQADRLKRTSALAVTKQAELEAAMKQVQDALARDVQMALLEFLHHLLARVETLAMGQDESGFSMRRSHEYAREVLAQVARGIEADFSTWVQAELVPTVQAAYEDLVAATRAELNDLTRELKVLDGLAFGGLHGMRLSQSSDAGQLIENLEFHKSVNRAHVGVAVGSVAGLTGVGLVTHAVVSGVIGLLFGGVGILCACLGGAVGIHHGHTLAHLKNSAPEIKQQAALELQTRLANHIDDESENGLMPTLTRQAVKPIDDAVRHIYGTFEMQLSAVDKARQAYEQEREALNDAIEVLDATLGAWNKLITRTEAITAPS